MLNKYEQTLLEGWEEVHKKGQLTLWILLALKDSPKHMANIKLFILKETNGLLEADDKSMYRALRRFNEVEIVAFTIEKNKRGPDRKLYYLTKIGKDVLAAFIQHNILDILLKPSVLRLLKS